MGRGGLIEVGGAEERVWGKHMVYVYGIVRIWEDGTEDEVPE